MLAASNTKVWIAVKGALNSFLQVFIIVAVIASIYTRLSCKERCAACA